MIKQSVTSTDQEGGVKKKVEKTELQKTSWEMDRDASMEKIVERHNVSHSMALTC